MPIHFEFERKTAQLNMRVPKPLLDAVKNLAARSPPDSQARLPRSYIDSKLL